jgi:hypothetical protein
MVRYPNLLILTVADIDSTMYTWLGTPQLRRQSMSDASRAVVREIDGKLVLDDPVAMGVARAVGKHNCRNTIELNADRIEHFKRRLTERQLSPSDVVIVILNVDDIHGSLLAEALMPGTDWQEYRDRGEIPFARGLAERAGITESIDHFDQEAGAKLRDEAGLAVVVVDHGVAEVFPV